LLRLEDRTVPSTVPAGADALTFSPADYVFSNGTDSTVGAAKWPQPGGLGSSVTITYSYSASVTGGLDGLSYAQIRASVQEALGQWARYAPLKFVEVADAGPDFTTGLSYNGTGDPMIRIGAKPQDGQYGVLAYTYYPGGDGLGGDMVLDSDEVWGTSPGTGRIDFLQVVEHELGHALGMAHETTNTAIMNPVYAPHFSGPGTAFLYPDDIAGIQALYGAGTGSVTPVGGTAPGKPIFTVNGTTLTVTGSTGDDTFIFQAGTTQHVIIANGVRYNVNPATLTKVVFVGGGGNDSLTVYGTAGNESVSLDATQLVMTGSKINFQATGFESIIVNGNGGNDTATMGDTPGNDQVALSYAQATLQGSGGQYWQLNGFSRVTALSTHGVGDAVYFYGSPGNDTFIARPGGASLTGAGYQLSALGFTTTQARNGGGGSDVAYLYDSPGNDVFSSSNGLAWLQTSDGYNLQTFLFGPTFAYSTGGYDAAYLYGTAAADSFVASPFAASMSTPGSLTYAIGFDFVAGFGNGGSDVTALYGSSGNDNFYDSTGFTSVQAMGVTFQAYGFTGTYLIGNGGSDTASVYDSPGNDAFYQNGAVSQMFRSDGTITSLYNMAQTQVYAINGGTDYAYLSGSSGNDTFYTQGAFGTLASSTSVTTLHGFNVVYLLGSTGFDIVSALSAPTYTLNKTSTWVG
jgi:hypothetical protein